MLTDNGKVFKKGLKPNYGAHMDPKTIECGIHFIDDPYNCYIFPLILVSTCRWCNINTLFWSGFMRCWKICWFPHVLSKSEGYLSDHSNSTRTFTCFPKGHQPIENKSHSLEMKPPKYSVWKYISSSTIKMKEYFICSWCGPIVVF